MIILFAEESPVNGDALRFVKSVNYTYIPIFTSSIVQHNDAILSRFISFPLVLLESYSQYGSYCIGVLPGECHYQALFFIGERDGTVAQELHALHCTIGVARCNAQ